ncbi:MAG TPA: hypothetical protein VK986_10850 [Tepidisphaeraceae bacterium]|nr:hypothetical protein [Tepidisphaeraceae bacterium]
MSIIEFQVDAGRFLAAQRSYLRRLALCPPVLPSVSGVQLVVDRVDVGPSTFRHDEPTTFDVFYVQGADQPGLNVTQPTPSTVRVDRDVVLPGIANIAFASITDMLAHPDGIALAGAFTIAEATNAAVQVLGVAPFAKHVPDISCGAASMAPIALFGQDPARFGILKAGASLGNAGSAQLHLCSPPVLQRLDGPVQPANVHVDEVGLPIEIAIDIGPPPQSYYDAPAFPIELMVRTNGGTRFIRFDPPPVVTGEDLERMQAGLLVKVGDCQQLVDPWFKLHGGYNPHWSPRPPEEGFDVLHHWEVVVAGLPEDERVELRAPDGRTLARAPGRGRVRAARVSVVVEPARDGQDLAIVRVGAAHEEAPGQGHDAGRGLEVRQTDLVVLGEVPLSAPSHALGIVELADGPAVLALLEDRVEAFDVRAGASAGAIASWPGRFEGLLRSPRGTLLYGADGVARLDAGGALAATPDPGGGRRRGERPGRHPARNRGSRAPTGTGLIGRQACGSCERRAHRVARHPAAARPRGWGRWRPRVDGR